MSDNRYAYYLFFHIFTIKCIYKTMMLHILILPLFLQVALKVLYLGTVLQVLLWLAYVCEGVLHVDEGP